MAVQYNNLSVQPAPRISSNTLYLLLFFVAHVPLALLLRQSEMLSTIHAWSCVAIGMLIATSRSQPVERSLYVCVYIAASEVIWRMTLADFFYEGAKYAVALIMLITAFRANREIRIPQFIIIFMMLMSPAVLYSFLQEGSSFAVKYTSNYFSAYIALFSIAIYFYNFKFDREILRTMCNVFITPVIAVCTIALASLLTATEVVWTTESNMITSGGANSAPNQVSAIIGLGLVMALLLVFITENGWMRLLYLGLSVWFGTQGVLTFSRGGVVGAIIPILILALMLFFNSPKMRRLFVILSIGFAVLGNYVIWPALNNLTGGKLEQRFSELSIEDGPREYVIQTDLEFFREHPFEGVGIGRSVLLRGEYSAHTEYTRVLAEHGLIGVLGYLVLAGVIFNSYRKQPSVIGKAVVLAFTCWVAFFLFHAGTRLVAPSLFLGICFAMFDTEDHLG